MKPQLSIIIVNYNKKQLLLECLQSICDNILDVDLEVIVVDNGSQDDSVTAVRDQFSSVRIIANQDNRGFSAANNQGAAIAGAEYLLFLNNDTRVVSGRITDVLHIFGSARIGVVGLGLINPDGSRQRQGSLLGSQFWKKRGLVMTDFVVGAALVIPARLFIQVERFDENFNFFNEDLDLCKKVKKAGYDIVYAPDFKILHYGGSYNKYMAAFSIKEGYRGGLYFFKKYYGKRFMGICKTLFLLDIIIKIKCMLIRLLYDKQKEKVRIMLSAYIDSWKVVRQFD